MVFFTATLDNKQNDYDFIYSEAIDSINNKPPNKLAIIFLQGVMGEIFLNEHCTVVNDNILLCLNHKDRVRVLAKNKPNIKGLYFTPSVVNSKLDIYNILEPNKLESTIKLDRDTLIPFLNRDVRYFGSISVESLACNRVNSLFGSIKKEIADKENSYWPCRIRSFFLELLFLAVRLYDNSDYDELTLKTFTEEIRNIMMYIYSNYQKKITIKELTKKFGINRNRLRNDFLQATGSSPVNFIIKYRLKIAAKLIKDTELSIAQVSERVGFNDLSHFNRLFVKYIGKNPSEYRRFNKSF